jgi:diguanylate cyclase (GGDEF)-like protein/PAS domain S-box-containing protein
MLLGAGVDLAVGAGLLPTPDPASTGGTSVATVLPSVAVVALAGSVLMLGLGGDRTARFRFWLTAFSGIVALLGLMSYVYGSASLFDSLGLTGTSMPTTIIGLLMVGSLLSARPDQPPLAGLDERYDRTLVRRVLPPLLAVPFLPALISWVLAKVDPDVASTTAISQLVTVLLLLVIVAVAGSDQSRARRELTTERQRLWEAFAHTPAPTAVMSLDGRVQMANAAFGRLIACSAAEIVGVDVIDLVGDTDRATVAEALARVVAGLDQFSVDVQLQRSRGGTVWVDFGAAPVRDVAGAVTYVIVQCNDLTDRKHLERLLADQATRDPLTGLLNREGLARQLRERRAIRLPGYSLAVVFADVDGLKALNDSVGHAAGDDLLREVARRLTACTRNEDIVARVGGDEFIVVTSLIDSGHDPAAAVVERLRREVSGTLTANWGSVALSVSLGASMLGEDDDDAAPAVARADKAMYADKMRRRHNDIP